MTHGRDLRTRFATRALDFAEIFKAGLGEMRLPPGDYAPELTAPDGPSTGGGVQAMQHVRLVPNRPGLAVLLVGNANQRGGTAELRSFDYLDAVHRERYGRPVALHRGEYDEFLQRAKNFFESNQLAVIIAAAPPGAIRKSGLQVPAPAPSSGAGVLLSGIVIGLLIAGLAIWLTLGRQHAASPPAAAPSAQEAPR